MVTNTRPPPQLIEITTICDREPRYLDVGPIDRAPCGACGSSEVRAHHGTSICSYCRTPRWGQVVARQAPAPALPQLRASPLGIIGVVLGSFLGGPQLGGQIGRHIDCAIRPRPNGDTGPR